MVGVSWRAVGGQFGCLDHISVFQPEPPPPSEKKTLVLSSIKARNGFSTLKIGGQGVDNPSHALVGCQLGVCMPGSRAAAGMLGASTRTIRAPTFETKS